MMTCHNPMKFCQGDRTPALVLSESGAAHDQRRACEREHRIAESLQRVLLRTHPPETLVGVGVEAFYEAVLTEATVGGDSFDAFALDGGRVALVVADASGKGLAAAERVAEIRFALRAFLREHRDPARALACLNDFVCDAQRLGKRDDSTFATMTLVVLSGASEEMLCLCAGGEPPLILRTDGMVESVPICGPALGLGPRQEYAAASVSFGSCDTVLLATDGLTEARCLDSTGPVGSRVGAFLGLEGLAHFAAEAHSVQAKSMHAPTLSASLGHLGRSVFEGSRRYAGGSFHDDVCLLVGRRSEGEKQRPLISV